MSTDPYEHCPSHRPMPHPGAPAPEAEAQSVEKFARLVAETPAPDTESVRVMVGDIRKIAKGILSADAELCALREANEALRTERDRLAAREGGASMATACALIVDRIAKEL